MKKPNWVWKRFLYVFIAAVIISFWWDGLSNASSKNCDMLTVFVTIILLIYICLKPERGEDKVEIYSAGEFLAPIVFFAGPILGYAAYFLAKAIRGYLF